MNCNHPPLCGLGWVQSFLLDQLSQICQIMLSQFSFSITVSLLILHVRIVRQETSVLNQSSDQLSQIMLSSFSFSITLSLPLDNTWTLSLAHRFYLSVNFREPHTNKLKKLTWHTYTWYFTELLEQRFCVQNNKALRGNLAAWV